MIARARRPSVVKSFRLYFAPSVTPPVREVADYSEGERRDFRDAFNPLASTYRRRARIGYIAIAGFMACVLVAMLFPKRYVPWFVIPPLVFWLIAIGSAVTAPRLVCPGCSNEIERSFANTVQSVAARPFGPGACFARRVAASAANPCTAEKAATTKFEPALTAD